MPTSALDIPAEHLARPRSDKFRDCPRRMTSLSTAVLYLIVLIQHPVNR